MTDYELSRPLKLEHIDRKGTSLSIEATADECTALSKRFVLESIQRLNAEIKIKPMGTTYHATGKVTGKVNQISVVNGNPVPTEIDQDVDAYFIDESKVVAFDKPNEDEYELRDEKDDPEKITDGAIDLGEVTAQFLGLALDDYPRGKDEDNGDYIEVKPEDAKPNPFAVLKDLKTKK